MYGHKKCPMMCRADTATQQNETYSLCFGTAKVIQVLKVPNLFSEKSAAYAPQWIYSHRKINVILWIEQINLQFNFRFGKF